VHHSCWQCAEYSQSGAVPIKGDATADGVDLADGNGLFCYDQSQIARLLKPTSLGRTVIGLKHLVLVQIYSDLLSIRMLPSTAMDVALSNTSRRRRRETSTEV
jgi:hypothetical protein